jgi:hypothetical protein
MGWILGEKFDTVYPHRGSIEALWETKWKAAVCSPEKQNGRLS